MLQFFHTIDTAGGWFRGATLTDKILIFRLLSISVDDMRRFEYSGGPRAALKGRLPVNNGLNHKHTL